MNMYWILFIGTALVSWLISMLFNSRMKKYSNIRLNSNMTGAEVARKMLRDNGIDDVEVVHTGGNLTDHYNPMNKTVNLSDTVFASNSVAAAAVAAHECGHAVQHAKAYAPLKMRSALVPVVSFSSKYVMWILLGGMLVINTFPQLMLAGIILFAMTTLFSFITLPVEINASKRALVWLRSEGITDNQQQPMAESALNAAAYTYVVAALSSLATLMYYIYIFIGRRN
ncbi:membrane protein [Porphyromonadaceae bacterium COT-184 OH4590]|nr:membrane protein [Porphyromonadaceae bacterium COT-184 OH4590]MDO4726740.1 zinc metallopeptidase [Porphyromonadaceae bacterium]